MNKESNVNLEYLYKACAGDETVVEAMVQLFLEQLPIYVEELRQSFAGTDWQSVKSAAHKAKSSAAIMGLTDMSECLREIELIAGNEKRRLPVARLVEKVEEQALYACTVLRISLPRISA